MSIYPFDRSKMCVCVYCATEIVIAHWVASYNTRFAASRQILLDLRWLDFRPNTAQRYLSYFLRISYPLNPLNASALLLRLGLLYADWIDVCYQACLVLAYIFVPALARLFAQPPGVVHHTYNTNLVIVSRFKQWTDFTFFFCFPCT